MILDAIVQRVKARLSGDADAIANADTAFAAEATGSWSQWVQTFRIDPDEECLMQVCLALQLEPSLRGALTRRGGTGYVTEPLVGALFGRGSQMHIEASGPLRAWRFVERRDVEPSMPASYTADPSLRGWLLGEGGLDPLLVGAVRERSASSEAPVPPGALEEAVRVVKNALRAKRPIRVVLGGVEGVEEQRFTERLATELGVRAFFVDADAFHEDTWTEGYIRAQRLAALARGLICWSGRRLRERWPTDVSPAPIQVVTGFDAGELGALPGVWEHPIRLPLPSVPERAALWRTLLPSSDGWDSADAQLARHPLTVSEMEAVAERRPQSIDEAAELVRAVGRRRLGREVELMATPFTREDLVVPESVSRGLDVLVNEARLLPEWLAEPSHARLFPRGTGVVALFHGPPGTGKTMAAQVVARELGLDLHRVDLALTVSKYIGETAKNLRRLFERLARSHSVIFFDEADALFAKRTDVKDAHDRHANTDTNTLLQLLEAHDGVALLATNRRGNLDAAFVRRIRHVIELPKPSVRERQRLWARLSGALCRWEPADELSAALAEAAPLSGAQIKQAVLTAALVAHRDGRPVGASDLALGLEREVHKTGVGLEPATIRRLKSHGR